LIDTIKKILAQDSNTLFAYLFGSAITKNFSKFSDVDIAIYFKNYSLDAQLDIAHKLEKEIKRDIDITPLNRVKNIYLLEDIIYNSKLLKENQKRVDFELSKWHEINDFKISKRLIDAS
jgi:predicted nucleotidyltransferase